MSIAPASREPRSPEREALATAITSAADAERTADRGRVAVARATELVAELESKLAVAVSSVARAREHQGRRVAAAVSSGRVMPASVMRAARDAELEAEDALESALAAVEQLRTRLTDFEDESRRAALNVEAAVNAVLGVAAAPLIEEFERIKSELPKRQSALHYIRMRAFVDRVEIPALAAPLAEISPRIEQAIEIGLHFHPVAADQHPVAERWRQACAALRSDADAALPT
jgi:hypothetical protein